MPADVLIVDNDERIVELVAWFLRKRGYRVRAASDFSLARRCIAERAPDLMLSDLDLGEQSALEELPAMEAEGCLPPTLVVSGYLDQNARERLANVKAVLGTLAKPFDFPVLEARVVECLAQVAAGPGIAPVPRSSDGPEALDDEGWIEITPRDSNPLRGAR